MYQFFLYKLILYFVLCHDTRTSGLIFFNTSTQSLVLPLVISISVNCDLLTEKLFTPLNVSLLHYNLLVLFFSTWSPVYCNTNTVILINSEPLHDFPTMVFYCCEFFRLITKSKTSLLKPCCVQNPKLKETPLPPLKQKQNPHVIKGSVLKCLLDFIFNLQFSCIIAGLRCSSQDSGNSLMVSPHPPHNCRHAHIQACTNPT